MRQRHTPIVRIGAYLLAARQEAGLTQEAAADEIGTHASQISNWEHNVHTPTVYFLLGLAGTYDCSPLRLLGCAPEPSPTDPTELGAWLRALPGGTILRSASGNAWQIDIGIESGSDDDREFPALMPALGRDPFEITEEHPAIDVLAELAPFTVLALGEASDG